MSVIGKTRTNQPVDADNDTLKDIAIEGVEGASSGTINKVLGLDTNGNLVKGDVSSGTKLYIHIVVDDDGNGIDFISTSNSDTTTYDDLILMIRDGFGHKIDGYPDYLYHSIKGTMGDYPFSLKYIDANGSLDTMTIRNNPISHSVNEL